MTFNTQIVRCEWQSDSAQWKVRLSRKLPDGSVYVFEEYCDVLLHATGLLHHFKWPDIDGLLKFKGKVNLATLLAYLGIFIDQLDR